MKYLFSMLLFCAALTLSAESKFLKVSEFQYDFDKKSITFRQGYQFVRLQTRT